MKKETLKAELRNEVLDPFGFLEDDQWSDVWYKEVEKSMIKYYVAIIPDEKKAESYIIGFYRSSLFDDYTDANLILKTSTPAYVAGYVFRAITESSNL